MVTTVWYLIGFIGYNPHLKGIMRVSPVKQRSKDEEAEMMLRIYELREAGYTDVHWTPRFHGKRILT